MSAIWCWFQHGLFSSRVLCVCVWSQHLLVLATPVEIVLLGVQFRGSTMNEILLYPSMFSVLRFVLSLRCYGVVCCWMWTAHGRVQRSDGFVSLVASLVYVCFQTYCVITPQHKCPSRQTASTC